MEMPMGERMSERLAGSVLLKHSNLNDLQRELLMLRSPILRTFDEIANLLRTLDRSEMLNRAQGSSKNYATFHDSNNAQVDENANDYDEDNAEYETDEESSSRDEQGNSFVYFEDRVFSEQESMEIMAYHSAHCDVRRELQKRRNEQRDEMDVEKRRANVPSNHTVLARARANSTKIPKWLWWTPQRRRVIGHRAMEPLENELAQKGLRVLWQQHGPLPGAGGIGGAAKVKGTAHVPIGVAKTNGALHFTVLQDGADHQTPSLLPISWLESVGAMIDCKHNQLILNNGESTDMRRLPTKHRAINVMEFAEEGWDLPRDLRRDPDVDSFLLRPQPPAAAYNANVVEQKVVKVWLVVDETLHHLTDLPAERWSMVLPSECGIQDPSMLEPQRVTYAYLRNGRHLIIRDFWQPSTGERNLENLDLCISHPHSNATRRSSRSLNAGR
eukprot:s4601_g5.t1